MNTNTPIIRCFLDLCKAFVLVSNNIVWKKLRDIRGTYLGKALYSIKFQEMFWCHLCTKLHVTHRGVCKWTLRVYLGGLHFN